MYNETTQPWAEFYATSYGWHLFHVHGWDKESGCCTCGDKDCPNPGKHPSNSNGFKGAIPPQLIGSAFAKGDRNIGLATGVKSGVFVLDIDGMVGEKSLRELEEVHGKLPQSLTCQTGGGRHIYFNMPKGVDVKCSTSKVGDKLDIRGNGGYTILPPSMHWSGVEYRWSDKSAPISDAPKWLIDLATKEVPRKERATEAAHQVWPVGSHRYVEIESATNALDPDLPYEDWVKVGMAVKAAGGSFEIWDSWSARGEKYKPKEMPSKWDSFSSGGGITSDTLDWMAREAGWENPFHKDVKVDLEAIQKNWDNRERERAEAERRGLEAAVPRAPEFDGWPFDPLGLDGMIGETVRWITETSLLPQPHLALLATLATLGGMTARKYALEDLNTRTNLYTVGLARTGSGKDHARKMLRELAYEGGFDNHMGPEDFISAPGTLQSLRKQPSQVMLVDEAGMVFKAMADGRAASFKKDLTPLLLKLYSSSGASSFSGGTYADAKREATVIKHPCLSIYGTSTRESYAESLTSEMIASGHLNRWVVLPGDDEVRANRRVSVVKAPELLRSQWMKVASTMPPKKSETDITDADNPDRCPEPIIVRFSDEAEAVREKMFGLWQDRSQTDRDKFAPLWVRFFENGLKIGMLFAIARNPEKPIVNKDDLQIGSSMVEASIRYIISVYEEDAFEDLYEKKMSKLTTFIKESTERMGHTTKTMISRKFGKGMKPKLRDEILEHLLSQEAIQISFDEASGGRPVEKITYVG